MKSDGKKDDDEAGGDGENSPCNFLHGGKAGFQRSHTLFDVADDIFEDDDGIVDDDADGENEGQKGENINAVTECVEQSEGPKNGDGNGGSRNDGGAGFS